MLKSGANDLNNRENRRTTSVMKGCEDHSSVTTAKRFSIYNENTSKTEKNSDKMALSRKKPPQSWLTPFQLQKIVCTKIQKWLRKRLQARRAPRIQCANRIQKWLKYHTVRRSAKSTVISAAFKSYQVRKKINCVQQFVRKQSLFARQRLLEVRSATKIQVMSRYFLKRVRINFKEKYLFQKLFVSENETGGNNAQQKSSVEEMDYDENEKICTRLTQKLSDLSGHEMMVSNLFLLFILFWLI